MARRTSLAVVNAMDADAFRTLLGAVFEHSPWVAASAYDQRPFGSIEALHAAMVAAVTAAPAVEVLALLQAHPELARPASLTAASAAEQAQAGLDRLPADEAEQFDALNRAYRDRFGFPFIIAVRGVRDRGAMLAALRTRLTHSAEQERAAALAEVARIARFRLDDLIEPAGRLTVHVLDTATGRPAAGMVIFLCRLSEGERRHLGQFRTNADGRCDRPLLDGGALRAGDYETVFLVGAWRTRMGGGEPGFYDEIPIRFRVTDPGAHHHIPLILAPHGYSTYRGS